MSETKPARPAPRLQTRYLEHVRPTMQKEFNYTNPMQVPRLEKIVINMGVGEAAGDQKKLDAAVADLTLISGQRPVKTIAKKAIAGFKIRAGLPIGTKVTLRRARMYEFLDRLVTIALPRVRHDRQGVRWPWKFRDGPEGTDHFPRDCLRQGGCGAGHGYRDRDHGQDRC
jgi:large subunit ribosomal protein L5